MSRCRRPHRCRAAGRSAALPGARRCALGRSRIGAHRDRAGRARPSNACTKRPTSPGVNTVSAADDDHRRCGAVVERTLHRVGRAERFRLPHDSEPPPRTRSRRRPAPRPAPRNGRSRARPAHTPQPRALGAARPGSVGRRSAGSASPSARSAAAAGCPHRPPSRRRPPLASPARANERRRGPAGGRARTGRARSLRFSSRSSTLALSAAASRPALRPVPRGRGRTSERICVDAVAIGDRLPQLVQRGGAATRARAGRSGSRRARWRMLTRSAADRASRNAAAGGACFSTTIAAGEPPAARSGEEQHKARRVMLGRRRGVQPAHREVCGRARGSGSRRRGCRLPLRPAEDLAALHDRCEELRCGRGVEADRGRAVGAAQPSASRRRIERRASRNRGTTPRPRRGHRGRSPSTAPSW